MSLDPVSRLEQAIDLAEMSHNVSLDGIRAAIEQHVAEAVAREREELLDLVDSYAKDNADLKDAIRTRAEKETK
jgi:hypothetical protein